MLAFLLLLLLILRFQQLVRTTGSELECEYYVNNQSSNSNLLFEILTEDDHKEIIIRSTRFMEIFIEKISLKCQSNESIADNDDSIRYTLTFMIKMFNGFEIKNSKLISIENHDIKNKNDFLNLTFYFEFCYFQFYKQQQHQENLKLLNESSSFDLFSNYFDLISFSNNEEIYVCLLYTSRRG